MSAKKSFSGMFQVLWQNLQVSNNANKKKELKIFSSQGEGGLKMVCKKRNFVLAFIFWLIFASIAFAGAVTYQYDSLNRLIKAAYSDGTVVQYTYDAAGNRISKKVSFASGPQPVHYSCSQSCEDQCGGDIACTVECNQYWQDCCQDGLDICQPQCPLIDPPSVHRVGLCDQGCQAEAPLKVSGSRLDVCFNYTGPVNILAGVLSDDFRNIWWLRPDCSLYSNYSQAVDSGNGLSCQGISMPVEKGYFFWLVSPVDLSHLDWSTGIYELLFYQVP
jgi:YD repeat-containing protein